MLSSQTLASYVYTLDANGNRTRAVELVQGLTQGGGQSLPSFGSVRSGAVSASGSRTGVSGFSGGAAHDWLARWPAATTALMTTIDYSYDNLAR